MLPAEAPPPHRAAPPAVRVAGAALGGGPWSRAVCAGESGALLCTRSISTGDYGAESGGGRAPALACRLPCGPRSRGRRLRGAGGPWSRAGPWGTSLHVSSRRGPAGRARRRRVRPLRSAHRGQRAAGAQGGGGAPAVTRSAFTAGGISPDDAALGSHGISSAPIRRLPPPSPTPPLR